MTDPAPGQDDWLAATPASREQAGPAFGKITLEAAAAREETPAVPLDVKADPRSYLGRAAARGLPLAGFQPASEI